MPRNIFAGGGVNAFQGENSPLYVQNMNSLKAAFTDLQNDIAGATSPIGSVVMWAGTTANIPTGYAVANGAYLNTITYASLYAIIGTRYGPLVGATFPLPNLTSRLPQGTIGVPTVPTTKVTSVSSNVDVHTHTVNSSFTAGNAASHTHSGSVLTAGNTNTSITAPGGANTTIGVNSSFTAGNASAHLHTVIGNTGSQSDNHVHAYFKPNSGANTTTGIQQGNANHSHGILFNSGNTAAGVNSSFTAGNAADHTHAGGVLTAGSTNTSITAPGAPNTTIGVNSSFTAGNATTINTSTLSHTHNFEITELVFIIRVS